MRREWDAVVIGGGSAGLAAAATIAESGFSALVVEREDRLGGVLVQCVHDGFGLHTHGESLTGPEYASWWERRARDAGVRFARATTALSTSAASDGFAVDVVGGGVGGRADLRCRALVCATGCRERTRGALRVPGGRPAGVFTAGEAQYMVNVANQMPGTKVAVLGSGDIGLIMARRLTLEGAEVRLVLGQEATGLLRNHVNCIEDFGIPIRYGWGLAQVHGFGQLQGITVAPMGPDGALDLSRREYVRVNALLLAVGLIPEREVLSGLDPAAPGLFACGNADRPHDLVDQVVCEAVRCGLAAASYLRSCIGLTAGCFPKTTVGTPFKASAERGEAAPPGTGRPSGADALKGVSADGAGAFQGVSAELDAACGLTGDLARLAQMEVSEPKGRLSEIGPFGLAGAGGMRRIACTVCPKGCIVSVDSGGEAHGCGCERGRAFALEELECPRRIFTGTVACADGSLVPVRSEAPVPRSSLLAVARACRRAVAGTATCAGDVVVADAAGTGVALVATAGAPGGDARDAEVSA